MGWSCRREAGNVLNAWMNACLKQTNSQNTFEDKGKKYFFETSRTEHSDGAITGCIWKFVSEDRVKPAGTFRIEGNGTVTRAPAFLKKNSVKEAA